MFVVLSLQLVGVCLLVDLHPSTLKESLSHHSERIGGITIV